MSEPANRAAIPWLVAVLSIALAAGNFYWTNRNVEQLEAAPKPHEDSSVEDAKQAISNIQQSVRDIQSNQQKVGDQIIEMQRNIAAEGDDRKLMSDQVGALSTRVTDQLAALSSRVDALASANAEATSAAQSQKERRSRR